MRPSWPNDSRARRVLSIVPSAMITLQSGETGTEPCSVITASTRRPSGSLVTLRRMTCDRGTTMRRLRKSSPALHYRLRAFLYDQRGGAEFVDRKEARVLWASLHRKRRFQLEPVA